MERTITAVGLNRFENDSEHSYQLAMLAWYLIESDGLGLNKDLVIKYCLMHDLVEAFAGDVDPHISSEEDMQAKKLREAEAMKVIKESFRECPSFVELIQRYESKIDAESRFVYALDKMQPILNVYLDSGDYYRKNNVSLERWLNYNKDKVHLSPEATLYFNKLLALLEQKKGFFSCD